MGRQLSGLAHARVLRTVTALSLTFAVSATGFVALAAPSRAATTPVILSSPVPSTDKDTTPTWTFDDTVAPDYECAFDKTTVTSPAFAACAGGTFTPTAMASDGTDDGTYTFSVRELGGDASTTATRSYTLDTVGQVSVIVAPLTNALRPTWTISPESGTPTLVCTLDGTVVACPSDGQLTPAADLSEGTHDLVVDITDDLGNTGSGHATTTIDTTGPAAPTVSGPTGPGNDATPTWTWNAAGNTSTCSLVGPSSTVAGACTSPYSPTLTEDGSYTLSVTLTDAATNPGTPGTLAAYTYDTVLPAAPSNIVGPTVSPAKNRLPSWTFDTTTAETNCTLTGPSVIDAGDCNGGTFTPSAALADGDWTLVVTAISPAGNKRSASSGVYTVDNVGPAAPTVSAPAADVPHNTSAPVFTWVGDLPSHAWCTTVKLPVDPSVVPVYTDCDVRSYTAVLSGDGSYRVDTYLVDPAGNVGAVGSSPAWAYDHTMPATPVLTGAGVIGGKGHDKQVTFTFSPEPQATALCWYSPPSGPDSTKADCSDGSFEAVFPSDGIYTVHAQQTDQATNDSLVGGVAYDLDSTLPTAPTVSLPNPVGNVTTVTWTITPNDASAISCRLLSSASVTLDTAADCSTGYTGTFSSDGTYTLEVTATNDHQSTRVVTSTYQLDTVVPLLPTVTGPATPGSSADPEWTFPVEAGTTAQCRLVTTTLPLPWSACNAGSFKPGLIADGTYTVDVVVTDLAGNSPGTASSTAYVSDRTKPAAPTVVGPATSPGNDPLVSWAWSGESGAKATCRLDRGGSIGTAALCGTTSGTYAPLLSGDSTYVVTIQLQDAAGNVSDPTTAPVYQLDTARPTQPVVTGTQGIDNVRTAVWTFGVESLGSAKCALDDGSTTPLVFTTCHSGDTVTLPGDGQFHYVVRTYDQAGNVSLDGTGPLYTYDGTKPAPPSVAGPATSPSVSSRPSFAFTAETTSTECHVLRSGALVVDWIPCTSAYTPNLDNEVDGTYVVEVRVTDAAGNVSDPGSSLDYVLDRQKPDAFVVTGPAGPSTSAAPRFSWPATEANLTASCQLFNGATAGATTDPCTSPFTAALTADGTWSLHVTTKDQAGNTTTAVSGGYVFDTTPPTTPVVHAPLQSPGRDVKPSWNVDNVEAGSTQRCRITTGTGSVVTDWYACTVPVTTDLTGRPDGDYVLNVQSTDRVGLTSGIATATYSLDSLAPDPPTISLKSPVKSPGNTRSVPFVFSAESASTVVCQLTRGGTVLSTQTGCASPSSVSLTGLPEGPYAISAVATDKAGNASAAASVSYVLDVTAPASPVLSAAPVSIGSGRSPTWSFTTESKAVVTCRLVGSSGYTVPDSDCSSGTYAPDLTAAPNDAFAFYAFVTDEAGNAQPTPLRGSYTLDDSAPAGPTALPLPARGNVASVSWFVSAPSDRVVCGVTRTVAGVVTTVQAFTDCGSPFTITLPADGVYVFSAHTVDAALNTSANITATYRLDTVPPLSAVLTAPQSPAAGVSPEWSIASPENTPTATCTVTGPRGAVLVGPATCGISTAGTLYPVDLTNKPDGAYTLTVHVVDRAGNVNLVDATSTYVLDTTAPNTVLVTPPVTPASGRTPTWDLVGDSDATLECRLSSGTAVGSFSPCAVDPLVPGAASFTADLSLKADGTYTFTTRSRDLAGNIGPETTSSYTLDTVKPAIPAAPQTGPSPSQVSVVSWTFSVEQGSSAYCTLTSATGVIAADQPCTSPWVTDLTGELDGDFALSIRAQDLALNSSDSVSTHYVLDRQKPTAPLITSSPGSPSPDTTPGWRLQASDDADLLECQLAGAPSPAWAACADPVSFDLSPATTGTYQLLVRETDAAGNVSDTATSPDYQLDLNAPAPPDVAPPVIQRSNSTQPVFVISRQLGDVDTQTLQCTVTRADGKTSAATPCTFGPNTVDLAGASFDGPVVLFVRGIDALGNVSGAASATYSFDNLPPARPTLVGPSPNASFDKKVEFTFGGVADAAHYVCELRRAGQAGALPTATCASPDKVSLPTFGSYVFSVWAVDKAGNRSATAQTATATYLPPVPAILVLKGPTSGSDATPTWTFNVPLGYTVECLLGLPGGQALSYACTVPVTAARSVSLPLAQALVRGDLTPSASRASSFTANIDGRPAGTYTLTTRLTDAFGNVGEYGTRVSYRYTPLSGPDRITDTPSTPTKPGTPTVPVTPPTPTPPGVTGAGADHHSGDASPPPRTPTAVKGATGKGSTPALHLPSIPGISKLPNAISGALGDLGQKPTIPLLLAVVVVGFLLLQNQIDRRDPKLASAPVGAEPEMEFGPVRGRGSGLGGGAPA